MDILKAATARLNGVWDDPDLLAWGELHETAKADLTLMAERDIRVRTLIPAVTLRENFLAEYRLALLNTYPWAVDEAKLARFMDSVRRTVSTTANTWNCDRTSPALLAVWKKLALPGRPNLKLLRSLPTI